MAGIGFELRKILDRRAFTTDMVAYLYAALLSSGPWLLSIICLAILGLYYSLAIGSHAHEMFRSTVVYTYAFSLILTGSMQMVITRYLADRHYEHKEASTLSTLMTCVVMTLVFGTLFIVPVYSFFDISLFHKICGVVLFLLVSLIWIGMIFLSAIKDYNSIIYAFSVGTLISIVMALVMGRGGNVEGFLAGYILGQACIFFWLMARLLREYPVAALWDQDFLPILKKYWAFILIGFFFNFAIWADKIVFWFAPDARMIVPYFKMHDFYEGPIFYAYVTIVPTMAIFFLKIETSFYECYRQYFATVHDGKSLREIRREKANMVVSLKENLREALIVQGVITALCLLFAENLAQMLHLNPIQVPLLRVCFIGAFLQAFLSINFLLLLYFDLRVPAVWVSVVFFLSNVGLSQLSVIWGVQFYGYGYMYSCLISLLLTFYLLNEGMGDLEFIIFNRQPLS